MAARPVTRLRLRHTSGAKLQSVRWEKAPYLPRELERRAVGSDGRNNRIEPNVLLRVRRAEIPDSVCEPEQLEAALKICILVS